jgi:hypothetical protein
MTIQVPEKAISSSSYMIHRAEKNKKDGLFHFDFFSFASFSLYPRPYVSFLRFLSISLGIEVELVPVLPIKAKETIQLRSSSRMPEALQEMRQAYREPEITKHQYNVFKLPQSSGNFTNRENHLLLELSAIYIYIYI